MKQMINIYFQFHLDACIVNFYMDKIRIPECIGQYSALYNENKYYDFNWQSYNATYTPNTAFSDIYSAFQFTEPSQINSYPYIGVMNTYLGGGYVFKMMGDSSLILNNTQILESLNWIDKHTSALFVEFTLFNPNVNLFQYCSILFEILPSGNFVNSAQFSSIDLIDLNNSGLLSFKILMNIICMVFIVIFMIVEIRQMVQSGRKYFLEFNNYIELSIIAFSWAAFSMYLYRLYSAYEIYQQIREQSTNGLQSFFVNLQYTVNCDQLVSYFIGLCAAFATLRFINLLRFSKLVIVFLIAFKKSMKELFSFGLIFLIVWLSFVQTIYLIFNAQSYQFFSFMATMETCFQIILGKFNADVFYNTDSFMGPAIFIVYNVCIIFVMLNIFITILLEYYNLARGDQDLEREDPELFNYFKLIFCVFSHSTVDINIIYKDYWDTLPNRFGKLLERFESLVKIKRQL